MNYKLIAPIDKTLTLKQQIFKNRKIDDIENFTYPSVACLHDELKLKNISEAAELLLHHLKSNNKIFIQIDSDCDGYTSSAILLNWIFRYNPEAYKNIIFRIHDGKQHGVVEESLEEIHNQSVKLVIIPDAGSNQFDIHQKLADLQIDCLVIDHHESGLGNTPALIVNPKLDDYPNKELSGAGVVYKFCRVLDRIASTNIADEFLDLVALGMVADMMDTTSLETRRLIITGLNNIKNNFLMALIEKQAYSMRNEITPTTIGFYIAPLINATVRAGTKEEKEIIFNAFLESNKNTKIISQKRSAADGAVESIIEQAARSVTNIKSRQTKMRDKSIQKIKDLIEAQDLNKNKIITVVVDEEIDKNLSGLIANKLLNVYKKPVIILKRNEENFLRGSARGYELDDFKDMINKTELVEYAEGHANAFGVSLKQDNLDDFIEKTNHSLRDFNFENTYLVDYIFDSKTLKEENIFEIFDLRSLWGKGFEEPLFCIENLKLKSQDVQLLSAQKNPTLKLTYKNITFIKFGFSVIDFEKLVTNNINSYLNFTIIGKFSVNEWNGNYFPQIIIENFNIKGELEYYF